MNYEEMHLIIGAHSDVKALIKSVHVRCSGFSEPTFNCMWQMIQNPRRIISTQMWKEMLLLRDF